MSSTIRLRKYTLPWYNHLPAFALCGLLISSCMPFWESRVLPYPERTIVSNTLALKEKWTYRIKEVIDHPISYQGNLSYVRHGNTLTALNMETGNEVWTFESDRRIAPSPPELVVSDGVAAIYLYSPRSAYAEIEILDAITGKMKWKQSAYVVYSIAIGDGRIYVGAFQSVRAYDLNNGSLLWEMPQSLPSHTVINVYYDSNQVYVTLYNRIYVLDSKEGKVVKSFPHGGCKFYSISAGVIYCTVPDAINAIDGNDGTVQWRYGATPDLTYIPPSLVDGVLYFITKAGRLQSLDVQSRKKNWESTIVNPFSNVVVLKNKGYVISKDGMLHAFDLMNGIELGTITTAPRQLSTSQLGRPAIPSLIASVNTLVLTFGDSFVYALEDKSP